MNPWNLPLVVLITPRGRPLLPLLFLAGGPSTDAAAPVVMAPDVRYARFERPRKLDKHASSGPEFSQVRSARFERPKNLSNTEDSF